LDTKKKKKPSKKVITGRKKRGKAPPQNTTPRTKTNSPPQILEIKKHHKPLCVDWRSEKEA